MVFLCKITIGDMIFNAIHSVEIKSTWKKYTDTATIKIPKAIYYRKNDKLHPIESLREKFKVGMPVKIELGYNTKLNTEFEGYISRPPLISFPVEIYCEDEMWQLKRKEANVSIEDATVRQILEAAAPGYEIDCVNETFGDFSKKQTTAVQIFEELRTRAGLYTFFRGKRLVCGIPHADPKVTSDVATYAIGRNVIENNLQLNDPEFTKVKIYGSSIQNNGSVVYVSVGDEGGDIIRFSLPPNMQQSEIEKYLKRNLTALKNAWSYSGDFKSFGWPNIVHGQAVRFVDRIFEKRDSTHYIDEIVTTASVTEGYKRVITPGRRIE